MADLGTDLVVVPFLAAGDADAVDLVRRARPSTPHGVALLADVGYDPTGQSELFDLDVVDGRRNLAHALVLRLLTPRGSLAELGHAEYGSRLHELIGERKTSALRNLCRAYVLEAVAQEPRVEDAAVALDFDLQSETPSSFVFTLAVQPRGGGDPLPLALELGL
jgi:phage baseplate assembly protein W